MMYGYHMGAGEWILSVAVTLLVVALIVAAIIWLVRTQGTGSSPRPGDRKRESARELLDRRLASGEISEDQYRSLRAALRDGSTPAEPARSTPAEPAGQAR